MEEKKVLKFLDENRKYLIPNNKYSETQVREALRNASAGFESVMSGIPFKKPGTLLALSIFPGFFGVDHFYLGNGELLKGLLKLCTWGGFGIWWIADIIFAKKRCRSYNCQLLLASIYDPTIVKKVRDYPKTLIKVSKDIAVATKDLYKGIQDSFEIK